MSGVVLLNELAEKRFGRLFVNRLRGGGWRSFIDAHPMRYKALLFVAFVIFLPATVANIYSGEGFFIIEQKSVVTLFIFKSVLADLAGMGAGLDIPLNHVRKILFQLEFKSMRRLAAENLVNRGLVCGFNDEFINVYVGRAAGHP